MQTPVLPRLRFAGLAAIGVLLGFIANDVCAAEQSPVDGGKESSRYWLEPLRQNYALPYSYMRDPNQGSYESDGGAEPIENQEIKLQISLQVPLAPGDLFIDDDELYFGFTLKSFWQAYNSDISAPFRETNYRPEVFYYAPLALGVNGGTWFGRFGIEHESNGRTQLLSRSWNRVYVSMGYLTDKWAVMLQPWHRLSEDPKVDDGDPQTPLPARGDDNPDIEDYMGHFELTGAYIWRSVEFTGLFRRNFSKGHGAYEVGVSVPMWGRLRGYVQYFAGYGESMIDYNYYNRRIGIGVMFSDLL